MNVELHLSTLAHPSQFHTFLLKLDACPKKRQTRRGNERKTKKKKARLSSGIWSHSLHVCQCARERFYSRNHEVFILCTFLNNTRTSIERSCRILADGNIQRPNLCTCSFSRFKYADANVIIYVNATAVLGFLWFPWTVLFVAEWLYNTHL